MDRPLFFCNLSSKTRKVSFCTSDQLMVMVKVMVMGCNLLDETIGNLAIFKLNFELDGFAAGFGRRIHSLWKRRNLLYYVRKYIELNVPQPTPVGE